MSTDPNTAPPSVPYAVDKSYATVHHAAAALACCAEVDAVDQMYDARRIAAREYNATPAMKRDAARDMRATAAEIERHAATIAAELRATAKTLAARNA